MVDAPTPEPPEVRDDLPEVVKLVDRWMLRGSCVLIGVLALVAAGFTPADVLRFLLAVLP